MPIAKLVTRLSLIAAVACAALVVLAVLGGGGMMGGVLAYISDYSTLHILDTNTGLSQFVIRMGGISSISWSPDGNYIVVVQHHDDVYSIYTVDALGRHSEKVIDTVPFPFLSPGGNWFAYTTPSYDNIISIIEPGARRLVQQILTNNRAIGNLAWSPDSRRIAFVSSNADGSSDVHLVSLDNERTELLISNRSSEFELRPFFSISWSPDGQRIALTSNDGIYVVKVDNKQVDHIYGCWCDEVAWSPDGKWLAFHDQIGSTVSPGLHAINVDDRSVRRLTYHSSDRSPAWRPQP